MDNPLKNNIDIRAELIKFHQKYYSANLMKLAIFGKESLDELQAMAVELFSGIQNNNVDVPVWSNSIYLENQKTIKLFIVPVKDSRNLTISFQIPDLEQPSLEITVRLA